MSTQPKTFVLGLWLVTSFLSVRPALAQSEDPFSIRVESDLVLIHTEVLDEYRTGPSRAYNDCRKANMNTLYSLPFSEPFTPKDCGYAFWIHGLGVGDFHVFEDGVEQKIESVRLEPEANITARDNHAIHREWSRTPRGKWSGLDAKGWSPAAPSYFYRLAYVPTKPEEGKCRKIKVKADRPRVYVYATDQYCYTPHPMTDPLDGTKFGKQLETELDSDQRAKIPLSLQASFFYTDAQMALVDVVLGFPWNLQHQWKGAGFVTELQASIGVLGAAYKKEGTVASRFSDLACCDSAHAWIGNLLGDVLSQSANLPSRYETQIDLPTGAEYELRVILSDGDNFGRAIIPLKIDSKDGGQLAISSVVLSNRFRDAKVAAQEAAAVNLAPGYVPLVSKGLQFTPATRTSFKPSEHVMAYFEVYEPLLSQQPKTEVRAQVRIVDAQTGTTKFQFYPLDATSYERPDSSVVAFAGDLPIAQLPKGDYRVEAQATDSAGRSTAWRSASFTIE